MTVSDAPPSLSIEVLRQRADFLRAARADRVHMPGMVVQGRARSGGSANRQDAALRVGFTCSKKVGNAVARNRAKRRLREIARAALPQHGRPGWDYVLIGRAGVTANRDFQALGDDLVAALARLHRNVGSR